jgi:hypothetical protein
MTKAILKPYEKPQNMRPVLNSEVSNVTPYQTGLQTKKKSQELATYCVEQLYMCTTLK